MGKPEPPEPLSAPEWIVTFSDVISLLVTFFVLILTFSTLETQELEKLQGAMQGSFGVMSKNYVSNRSSIVPPSEINVDKMRDDGAKIPFARDLDDLDSELEDMMMKRKKSEELKISEIKGGLRIRLEADRLFDPNSAKIRSSFLPTLKELTDILGFYPNDIVVEGHTDTRFTGKDSNFPLGYEMAGDMARAVANLLVSQGDLPAHRVSVRSYGASSPLFDNDTPRGRAKNRRVEILILEQEKGF